MGIHTYTLQSAFCGVTVQISPSLTTFIFKQHWFIFVEHRRPDLNLMGNHSYFNWWSDKLGKKHVSKSPKNHMIFSEHNDDVFSRLMFRINEKMFKKLEFLALFLISLDYILHCHFIGYFYRPCAFQWKVVVQPAILLFK